MTNPIPPSERNPTFSALLELEAELTPLCSSIDALNDWVDETAGNGSEELMQISRDGTSWLVGQIWLGAQKVRDAWLVAIDAAEKAGGRCTDRRPAASPPATPFSLKEELAGIREQLSRIEAAMAGRQAGAARGTKETRSVS